MFRSMLHVHFVFSYSLMIEGLLHFVFIFVGSFYCLFENSFSVKQEVFHSVYFYMPIERRSILIIE